MPSTFYAATASDLIADIKAANLHGGANSIVLTAPTTSPYVLMGADNTTDGPTVLPVIAVGDALTIQTGNGIVNPGYGDTIDAGKHGRLFDVASGASLTLENVTLQNGCVQWNPGSGGKGGAIYNQGTLVLSQVAVQNNTAASYYSWDAAGGGIWSNGSLTVENSCAFQGNSAHVGINVNTSSGRAFGGAISIVGGTANITGSTFGGPINLQNWAKGGGYAYGGAVYVSGGTVTMSGDTVGSYCGACGFMPYNSAGAEGPYDSGGPGYGGGLCLVGGTVTLTNDSITGNFCNTAGGGIYMKHSTLCKVYLDSFTKTNTQHNESGLGFESDIVGGYTLLPQIGSFTASPNPVTAGSSLTLTASNITASTSGGYTSATITQLTFYYFDSSGTKHVLGTGTQTSPGVWTLTIKVNLAPGTYTLDAQAEDSSGLFSDPVALTVTVH